MLHWPLRQKQDFYLWREANLEFDMSVIKEADINFQINFFAKLKPCIEF